MRLPAKPEILSPAGSPEQLLAAVRSGADAVYLGAGSMNARRSAQNFTDDELPEAAAYCREYGVKLYVVMNTLVFDDELAEAGRLLELICRMPADGVIVQDLGLASLIRAAAPEMPLHASTQMSVHSPAALPLLRSLGFRRAVVAREMSMEELSVMAKDAPVELEAFVHGALCMSVSGQCLLSAVLGGRSGNRGRCAQPCRLPFRAGGHEFCLSLRDMSFVDRIDELAELGIASLKIEGRMKRPEYCAAATAVCRAAADREPIPAELRERLSAVFSRSGFTDGYLTGKRGAAMFGSRTREDVTAADSGVLASLHTLYKNERGRVPLDMTAEIRRGKPSELTAEDADGNRIVVYGATPAESAEGSLDEVRTAERLSKTGGTAFVPRTVECKADEGLYLPASAINALRRDAVAQMTEKRREPKPVACAWSVPKIEPHRQGIPELHAVFRDAEQIPAELPTKLCRIYVPLETPADELSRLAERGIELCAEAPRGLFGCEERIRTLLEKARECGVRTCMVHNLGLIEPVLSAGLTPYGGFGLNIANTAALEQLERLGFSGCEVSVELTLGRIAALGGDMPRAAVVYGRLPLMLTRNCPAALRGRCPGRPDEGCFITDRMGVDFPVRCRMGCSELLNSVPLDMTGRLGEIKGVEHRIMRFTTETPEQAAAILRSYPNAAPALGAVTRGLYYRGVE